MSEIIIPNHPEPTKKINNYTKLTEVYQNQLKPAKTSAGLLWVIQFNYYDQQNENQPFEEKNRFNNWDIL